MNRNIKLALGLVLPLGAAVLWLTVEPVRYWTLEGIRILSALNIEAVKQALRDTGPWGPLVSFFLMILQSLAAPIPAFLITFANAAVYGWAWGGLLSFTSSLAGAALSFALARFYGRGWVVKMTGHGVLEKVDHFFETQGSKSILLARLLPFMPFDVVSYAAGLTPIRFWPFLAATALGQLPATLVYSLSGDFLTGSSQLIVTGLLLVFAAATLVWIIRSVVKKQTRVPAAAQTTGEPG